MYPKALILFASPGGHEHEIGTLPKRKNSLDHCSEILPIYRAQINKVGEF